MIRVKAHLRVGGDTEELCVAASSLGDKTDEKTRGLSVTWLNSVLINKVN